MKYYKVNLRVFRQYQGTRTIFKEKNKGQNGFKKRSKFQKLQFSNFTLTWSNEGKVNGARPYMTYSKELQQKMKMLDKLVLKNICIKQFQ